MGFWSRLVGKGPRPSLAGEVSDVDAEAEAPALLPEAPEPEIRVSDPGAHEPAPPVVEPRRPTGPANVQVSARSAAQRREGTRIPTEDECTPAEPAVATPAAAAAPAPAERQAPAPYEREVPAPAPAPIAAEPRAAAPHPSQVATVPLMEAARPATPRTRRSTESLLGELAYEEDGGRGAQIRAAAAYTLGETGDEAAIEPLIVALGDSAEVVRAAAAGALAVLAPLHPAARLDALAATGGQLDALARCRDERALEPLRRALVCDDPRVRAASTRALGEYRTGDPIPRLLMLLRDADPSVRAEAAQSIGRRGDARTVNALREVLKNDPDADVRAAAGAGLTELGHRPSNGTGVGWWEQDDPLDWRLSSRGPRSPDAPALHTDWDL